jgi:hypothetical protein
MNKASFQFLAAVRDSLKLEIPVNLSVILLARMEGIVLHHFSAHVQEDG